MSVDVSARVFDLRRLADFARAGRPAVVTRDGVHGYDVLLERVHPMVAGLGNAKMTDSRVGILFDRSLDSLAALVAVHVTGSSFVLLDPEARDRRGRDLASIARLDHLIGPNEHAGNLVTGPRYTSFSSLYEGTVVPAPATDPSSGRHPGECYVVFTSGSTGAPKGVRVGVEAISNHVRQTCAQLGIDSGSVLLQYAATQFDVCVSDLLCALSAGAALRMVTDDERSDLRRLGEVIREAGITHMSMPPTTMARLTPDIAPRLRALNMGGEVASEVVLRRWSAHTRVFVSYGPSECAVSTSAVRWTPDTPSGTIGVPHPGVEYLLLDPDGAPVAPGEVGELVIRGRQVMHGYITARSENTGRTLSVEEPPPVREYRTGDLARAMADGTYAFAGRRDRQVKINGIRIEPQEVETALLALDGVEQAGVVARDLGSGTRSLVAFVSVSPQGEVEGKADGEKIRRALVGRLPRHMVPALVRFLPELPTTPHGKVDLSLLAEEPLSTEQEEIDEEKPAGEVPTRLAELWRETLGVEHVHMGSDFFAIGGNSMHALTLSSAVKDAFGVDLSMRMVMDLRVLREQAAEVESELRGPDLTVDGQVTVEEW